jgi:hypothetical protein
MRRGNLPGEWLGKRGVVRVRRRRQRNRPKRRRRKECFFWGSLLVIDIYFFVFI